METGNSEVARLLQQYEQEYLAGKQGLTGLACGTARHRFITMKMERMGQIHGTLQQLVGDDATRLIADRLAPLPDHPQQGASS